MGVTPHVALSYLPSLTTPTPVQTKDVCPIGRDRQIATASAVKGYSRSNCDPLQLPSARRPAVSRYACTPAGLVLRPTHSRSAANHCRGRIDSAFESSLCLTARRPTSLDGPGPSTASVCRPWASGAGSADRPHMPILKSEPARDPFIAGTRASDEIHCRLPVMVACQSTSDQ